jgi:hypothetical protein
MRRKPSIPRPLHIGKLTSLVGLPEALSLIGALAARSAASNGLVDQPDRVVLEWSHSAKTFAANCS